MAPSVLLGKETKSASGRVGRLGAARHVSRWALRDAVTTLLPGCRVEGCGRQAVPDRVASLRLSDGAAYLAGVRRCGSVWLCPYCAAKVARGRAEELRRLVALARGQGYHVTLATYTLSHSAVDGLPDLLRVLTEAMRKWRGGRAWQRVAGALGYVGSVRNLEVTYGVGSGWHPHSHGLLITRERLVGSAIAEQLAARWSASVAGLGGYASLEHGLVFTDDEADVAGYVAKSEGDVKEALDTARGWGAAEELTYAHLKRVRDTRRLNAWGLLAALLATGERDYADRFVEYAAAFHGKRQLYWSRGLRDLFGFGSEATDEELAEASGQSDVRIATFTARGLCRLVDSGRVGQLLDVAESQGVEAAWLWLLEFYGLGEDAASFNPEWWEPDSGWLTD